MRRTSGAIPLGTIPSTVTGAWNIYMLIGEQIVAAQAKLWPLKRKSWRRSPVKDSNANFSTLALAWCDGASAFLGITRACVRAMSSVVLAFLFLFRLYRRRAGGAVTACACASVRARINANGNWH